MKFNLYKFRNIFTHTHTQTHTERARHTHVRCLFGRATMAACNWPTSSAAAAATRMRVSVAAEGEDESGQRGDKCYAANAARGMNFMATGRAWKLNSTRVRRNLFAGALIALHSTSLCPCLCPAGSLPPSLDHAAPWSVTPFACFIHTARCKQPLVPRYEHVSAYPRVATMTHHCQRRRRGQRQLRRRLRRSLACSFCCGRALRLLHAS